MFCCHFLIGLQQRISTFHAVGLGFRDEFIHAFAWTEGIFIMITLASSIVSSTILEC